MKLSFSFSKQQLKEVVFFAVVVAAILVLMAFNGADFR